MGNKENFYVFLDIDGVLWDWPWRLEQIKAGNFNHGCAINSFNPLSVQALNTLMHFLSNYYDCELVISSSWRRAMNFTIKNLKKNNVNMPQKIARTSTTNSPIGRGERISSYLQGNRNKDNFIILDDQERDFDKFFSPEKIIKTNIYSKSLRLSHIEQWINENKNDLKMFDKNPIIL